jgi:hypothetical protein
MPGKPPIHAPAFKALANAIAGAESTGFAPLAKPITRLSNAAGIAAGKAIAAICE